MDQNKYQNADKFDTALSDALQKHKEPVRPDFTAKILKHIDTLEEQKLLARIVMQQRLALAGCAAVAISAISILFFFYKDFVMILTNAVQTMQNTTLSSPNWKLIIAVSVTIICVIYASLDSLQIKQWITSKLFH